MKIHKIYPYAGLLLFVLAVSACKSLKVDSKTENKNVPANYGQTSPTDSTNMAAILWQHYFTDSNLNQLIAQALLNNQELKIVQQEIEISRYEIRARKGEYLPFVGLHGGASVEKVGKYTRSGAVESQLTVKPGTAFPEPLTDYTYGAYASWEVDIWKKLRNAKKSAVSRYLASIDGKNFLVTQLVAEIASTYYELVALDNLLAIVQNNITLQNNAFQIVKQQKEAAKVSQLAVNRFEAQLLNTTTLQFELLQQIVETENRLNFLVGRFPKPIDRNKSAFQDFNVEAVYAGAPAQLLYNRPDIRQAEQALIAAKLDVKVARANFYPAYHLSAGLGLQSFKLAYLFLPEALLYSLAGETTAPLINRNALKASYYTTNAQQSQAVYRYEQTILQAYTDVLNQLAKVENYRKSYDAKRREVDLLTQSVTISNNLYNAARADYMEVLLTQREALSSNVELIELQLKQVNAQINIYRALGGGWR